MRQIWIARTGAPQVLELREASDPEAGAGQVRVRVRASGINFADLLARVGLYPDAPKPPCVVGYEVSGTIDQIEGAAFPVVSHPSTTFCARRAASTLSTVPATTRPRRAPWWATRAST